MTLPKNITDAIDAYRRECLDDNRWEHDHKQAVDDSRAALEAAIAAAIQPVEPPTDAEVEAWEREARKVDLSVCSECPGELYEIRGDHLAKGLAIMRRARATDALAKLRERVQKEADNACEDYSAGLWRAVELIDEERGAGR